MNQTEKVFLPDEFVTITPGEPIPLFPLKPIFKGGKKIDIAAIARNIRLPHFKPAIKLGSHADDAPAAGHIIGLEVRDGHLWGLTEWTEKGLKAVQDGDYKYNSPEVLWEGGFENPDTGEVLDGPLIVGDALLHMPHLGESAALYSVDTHNGGVTSMAENETVTVPVSWLDRLFGREPEPEPEPTPTPEPVGVEPDKFDALKKERDDMAAKLQAMEAEQKRGERVAQFAAELKETVLDDDAEVHELLADMGDQAAAQAILTKFKALSSQIVESNLTNDIGNSGGGPATDPDTAFDVAIQEKVGEGMTYQDAAALVARENPELYKAWGGK